MRRSFLMAFALVVFAQVADAQYGYPRGYGGYGWGGFNIANNPNAGFMAGLGTLARDQGVYQVEKAQADSINLDTMLKWNKALRARQKALREEQRKDDARDQAARERRASRDEVEDGTTLNSILLQILEFDPGVVKSARARAPLSPDLIREIPFEWDTEAITICLDQMTGKDSLPPALMDSRYVAERNNLRASIEAAMKEEKGGSVSAKASRAASDAIDRFRDKFVKNAMDVSPGYSDATGYFSTLGSLVRLLNDPSMKKILGELEDGRPRTLGDLVAFMNAYNLRFGPAGSPRQVAIYQQLVPALTSLRDSMADGQNPPATPDRTGEGLRSAARGAFQGMGYDQLQAHARGK